MSYTEAVPTPMASSGHQQEQGMLLLHQLLAIWMEQLGLW